MEKFRKLLLFAASIIFIIAFTNQLSIDYHNWFSDQQAPAKILPLMFFALLTIIGLGIFYNYKTNKKDDKNPLINRPKYLTIIQIIIVINLFLNACFFASVTDGEKGIPENYNGSYVMAYKGKIIRRITQEDYIQKS